MSDLNNFLYYFFLIIYLLLFFYLFFKVLKTILDFLFIIIENKSLIKEYTSLFNQLNTFVLEKKKSLFLDFFSIFMNFLKVFIFRKQKINDLNSYAENNNNLYLNDVI